ncbi:uncharacterized protein LOC110860427 [Folsomia candida]|uniref:uncharacterized protein LOC110860427 n=1 Tax=Folsomia candida TaxID=158441 RepID=UPI001604BB38|nr:uncharacterized protein LOC110860427 [Folsomia candida]
MSQNLLLSPGSHHHHMLAGASGLPCPHRLSGVSAASSLGGGGIGAAGTSCGGNTVPSSRGGSIVSSSCVEELPLVGPPASALTRRPALVPPKLIPDHDYDGDGDGKDGKSWGRCSSDDLSTSPRNRRSSIVVIPPMQICPGDLLVYGKVLSQRKSLLGTPIESPSPIPTIFDSDSNQSRKGKVTWSLLKLFERSSRSKGGPSGTLEEIMNLIQPCDFSDPKLSRFKGMVWSDFVAHVCNQKTKKSGSVVSSGSSSGPSTSSSVNDFKYGAAGPSSAVAGPSTSSSTSPPTALKVSMTTSGAMATVMSSPTKTVNPAPSKPLVRKRMGLMRTMSDRCLERRITPALFRAQGFLMSEKLVEGKEPESGGPSGACGGGESSPPPVPAIPDPAATATNLAAAGPSTSRKSSSDETDPEQRQKLRQKEALWDLFQSECSFLYDHLMVLKNVFMEPLKRIQVEGFAMYAEPELLFGNLDELCAVTYAFCKEFIHLLLTLTDLAGSLPTMQVLAKLFEPSSKARAMSQAYHRYALNYINALNYLETLRRHVEFCDFEKLCMKDPRCKKLQLTDLLVSPVQHLMKVPLILKDIQGRTAEPQEKALIVQILEIQENSIRELDDKMRWLKNFERLLEIQRNIVWPSILEMEPKTWVPDFLRVALGRQPCDSIIVSPRRQIIYEGLLQLWDTGKSSECYVILFDDMLLITRRKKGLSKKKSSLTENWQSACGKSGPVVGGEGSGPNHRYIVYRQPISLDRFFIHDIADGETNSTKLDSSFVLVSLNRFQQIIAVHTFQAPSDQIKNTWLIKLKSTQDKWKRTLQTTVFRGVRSSTDSGQSNVASSILGLAHNKSFLHRHNTCESSN